MEPLFFKAENLDAAQALPTGDVTSMEPLFFKAENSTRPRNKTLAR